eukprot:GHVS01042196.1.p1 GENE.GHVS01042196.1~~GHVS01042196.1.p1  ORF type:complete len:636 (+),score=158.31 GHVS01042196.1:563-2470(+)
MGNCVCVDSPSDEHRLEIFPPSLLGHSHPTSPSPSSPQTTNRTSPFSGNNNTAADLVTKTVAGKLGDDDALVSSSADGQIIAGSNGDAAEGIIAAGSNCSKDMLSGGEDDEGGKVTPSTVDGGRGEDECGGIDEIVECDEGGGGREMALTGNGNSSSQCASSSPTTANLEVVGEGLEPLEPRDSTELEGGVMYFGQWRGDSKEGKGKLTRPDGSEYVGGFKKDKAEGEGVFRHTSGDVYDGQWEHDQACGYGTFVHADGSSYRGQWMNDLQQGHGVEKWTDGSSFEGHYIGSKKQGEGKFYWAEGSVYEGQFYDNEIHGEGWYKWADGRQYLGQWQFNHMDGTGQMTWLDGRSYSGHYVGDKKEGEGEFKWPDGRSYRGQWKDGKQHGIGTYRNVKGVERMGEWVSGKRIRWIEPAEQQKEDITTAGGDNKQATPVGEKLPAAEQLVDGQQKGGNIENSNNGGLIVDAESPGAACVTNGGIGGEVSHKASAGSMKESNVRTDFFSAALEKAEKQEEAKRNINNNGSVVFGDKSEGGGGLPTGVVGETINTTAPNGYGSSRLLQSSADINGYKTKDTKLSVTDENKSKAARVDRPTTSLGPVGGESSGSSNSAVVKKASLGQRLFGRKKSDGQQRR